MTTTAKSWPEFLRQLESHKYTVRPADPQSVQGYELYYVDLSDWKLRFSGRTPLIWVRADTVAQNSDQQLLEGLQDVTNQLGWRHQDCLVLLDGDGTELRRRTSERYFPRFVTIDTMTARSISSAHGFTGALLDWITDQVPISNLSPYQISRPAEGNNLFFGREKELDRILRQEEASFAVLGIRRIGKTSLLREAYRRMQEQGEPPERLVWLDCSTLASPEHFVQEVVRQVHLRELPRLKEPERFLFHFPNFLQRMSRMHGGRITIFLDEIDPLLNWASNSLDVLSALRQSVNTQACRYVGAGFIDLIKEIFDNRSPLFTLFEPLPLGPFEARETEEIVVRPMRSMRVRFRNEGAVTTRIHEGTGGHPLLIQFYCSQLVKGLDVAKSRELTPESVDGIYHSELFKQFMVNTFRNNTADLDKLLVYALLVSFPVPKTKYTQNEMYGALLRHGCQQPSETIDQACDRLVLAGVFARSGQEYWFANQALPNALRANWNLEFLLATTRKRLRL